MSSGIETFFSESDKEAIRAATAAVERTTSGELVVYVTERCDPHPEVAWKAALIGGAVGALGAALAVWRFGGWGAPDYFWMLIGVQLGVFAGWITSFLDGPARLLIDATALDSRVESRAARAFLEEQIFATQNRTGILIFVALFEHRVFVLADAGIHAHVAKEAWNGICEELAEAIRRGRPAPGLVHAVGRCADLLHEYGMATPDLTNELSDEPRFRRE